MNKVIRGALFIAVVYCAATYYFDHPEEVKNEAAAIREMGSHLPAPDEVMATAAESGEYAEQKVFRAKQRIDAVRSKVKHSIATGAERFAGAE